MEVRCVRFFLIQKFKIQNSPGGGDGQGKTEGKTCGEVATLLVKQYMCSRDLAERKPGSLCSEVKCEGKHPFCFYSEIVKEEVIVQKGSAFELKMDTS